MTMVIEGFCDERPGRHNAGVIGRLKLECNYSRWERLGWCVTELTAGRGAGIRGGARLEGNGLQECRRDAGVGCRLGGICKEARHGGVLPGAPKAPTTCHHVPSKQKTEPSIREGCQEGGKDP
jgi:hypothetical protein